MICVLLRSCALKVAYELNRTRGSQLRLEIAPLSELLGLQRRKRSGRRACAEDLALLYEVGATSAGRSVSSGRQIDVCRVRRTRSSQTRLRSAGGRAARHNRYSLPHRYGRGAANLGRRRLPSKSVAALMRSSPSAGFLERAALFGREAVVARGVNLGQDAIDFGFHAWRRAFFARSV